MVAAARAARRWTERAEESTLPAMSQDLDDPTVKRRLATLMLALTPVAFALCWVLAALQGAPAFTCAVIAGVAAAGTLGTAVSIGLFGSGSRYVFAAVVILIGLANFLIR